MSEIERVVDMVLDFLRDERMRMGGMSPYPEFEIYMNEDYWHECMRGIKGEVSPVAFEFFDSYSNPKKWGKPEQTLMGYKVYRVLSENHPAVSIKKV